MLGLLADTASYLGIAKVAQHGVSRYLFTIQTDNYEVDLAESLFFCTISYICIGLNQIKGK